VNPVILQAASRFLHPLLLLLSIFVLMRGHHDPGGGFIGGLIASAAFALHSIAYDAPTARKVLRADPHTLIAAGLLTAALSGVPGLLRGQPFLAARWVELEIPGFGTVHAGTPTVFDAGVYLVVVGVTLLIVFSLSEEEE
jgi:multicomponent Na+:H+ antiporter subunit B